jgi:hypothetical protein
MERTLPGPAGPADLESDPSDEPRAAGQRLASEFYISEDDALELVLGYGSETAVHKMLTERCWRGELERRVAA